MCVLASVCLYGHSEHALSPREPDRFNEGTIPAANIYKIQFRRRAHTPRAGTKITNILFIVALRIPSARSRDQLALKLRPMRSKMFAGVHIAQRKRFMICASRLAFINSTRSKSAILIMFAFTLMLKCN